MRHSPPTVLIWRDDDAGLLWVQWSSTTEAFETIKASFKHWFAGEARWVPERQAWRLSAWHLDQVYLWAGRTVGYGALAWRSGPPPLRERTRYDYQRGASGHRTTHSQSHTADPVTDAYRTLHLLPSAPASLVQAAQRVLIKDAHPDHGGTHEAAVAINRAVDIIREASHARAS